MKHHLVVVVQKSGATQPEEYTLKPKAAFELYFEIKAQQKRRWPEVSFGGYVNKKGERGDVRVLSDDTVLSVMTPEHVFVQTEEGVKTFTAKDSSKKSRKKSKKKAKK